MPDRALQPATREAAQAVVELTAAEARAFLVRRHFLSPPRALPARAASVLRVVRELGSVQFDPLEVTGARNDDLVLAARIRSCAGVDGALALRAAPRTRLFEAYNRSLNILPVEELPVPGWTGEGGASGMVPARACSPPPTWRERIPRRRCGETPSRQARRRSPPLGLGTVRFPARCSTRSSVPGGSASPAGGERPRLRPDGGSFPRPSPGGARGECAVRSCSAASGDGSAGAPRQAGIWRHGPAAGAPHTEDWWPTALRRVVARGRAMVHALQRFAVPRRGGGAAGGAPLAPSTLVWDSELLRQLFTSTTAGRSTPRASASTAVGSPIPRGGAPGRIGPRRPQGDVLRVRRRGWSGGMRAPAQLEFQRALGRRTARPPAPGGLSLDRAA
jgi:hypothetical protein